MQGVEYVVLAAAAGLLVARSPAARRAVGRGSRRAGSAARSGIRATRGRVRPRGAGGGAANRRGSGSSRPDGRWRTLAGRGWSWLSGLIWARPAARSSPPEAPGPAAPVPAATAPVTPVPPLPPAGLISIGDGALVIEPGQVFTRLDIITAHVGVAVDEFRALNRAIRTVGEVQIDPHDEDAVEQFLGWLSSLRGALIALGGAITEFAEQADQTLHLDGRVTSPIYESVGAVTDAAMLPQKAVQTLETLYAPQLDAMRAEGVRTAAPGFFDRQTA